MFLLVLYTLDIVATCDSYGSDGLSQLEGQIKSIHVSLLSSLVIFLLVYDGIPSDLLLFTIYMGLSYRGVFFSVWNLY